MSISRDDRQDAAAPRPRRRRWLKWTVFGFVAIVLLAGPAAVYLARRPIAAFVVQSYLLRHGIVSTVTFDRLERGGVSARVRIGGDTPEFSAEILDVTLDYPNLFALPTIGTVKLVRPVLRASYDGEKLSFGTLQPLVDQALSQEPEGPGPSFVVDDGTLFLSTPNGALQFEADAEILQGRLRSLTASIAPVMLHGDRFMADIAAGRLSASIAGDALDGNVTLQINALAIDGGTALNSHGLDATVELSGLEWQTGDNTLDFQIAAAEATIDAADAAGEQVSAENIETRIALAEIAGALAGTGTGDIGGPLRFSIANSKVGFRSGPGRVASNAATQFQSDVVLDKLAGSYENGMLRATAAISGSHERAGVSAGNESAARLSISTSLDPLTISFGEQEWSMGGPLRIGFDGTGLRHRLADGDIALRSLQATLAGTGNLTNTGIEGTLAGPIATSATLPRVVAANLVAGYLPLLTVEPRILAAATEAMREVSVRIPRLGVTASGDRLSFAASGATTVSSASGARFAFSPQGGRALAQGDKENIAGAFNLQIRGGGLPETQLTVTAYRARLAESGMSLTASAAVETTLDVASLNRVHLSGAGNLTSTKDQTSVALTRCTDVSFDSYINGGIARVTDSKVRLCANAAQPFLVANDAGWRLNAAWTDASARFDQAESRMTGANGRVALAGDANGPSSGRIELERATLSDLQTVPRFLPVNLGGTLDLKGQEWTGVLGLTVKDRRFASLALSHSLETGAGKADIEANAVNFDPALFQPTDISPLFASFGTRVRGRMDFTGRVTWDTEGIASDGRLRLANVDLQTALGTVNGIAGELALTSLMPVALAPSQTVTINRIDWLVPLEQAVARFSYDPTAVRLESASAAISGGRVSLDPLTLSFAPDATTTGTLRLDNIELASLFAAAGLAERVKVTSGISGVIPFTSGPNGLTFRNGNIAADAPGRLSIAREALTTAVNTGAGGQAPPNAVQDFAYQALESLAFKELTGMVNSTPTGRLGVLLHVKGQHDPATAVETRVGVADLLRGRAFDKPLPLPKGTPIDLTLDTSLNLNELLESYFGSRNGAAAPAP